MSSSREAGVAVLLIEELSDVKFIINDSLAFKEINQSTITSVKSLNKLYSVLVLKAVIAIGNQMVLIVDYNRLCLFRFHLFALQLHMHLSYSGCRLIISRWGTLRWGYIDSWDNDSRRILWKG